MDFGRDYQLIAAAEVIQGSSDDLLAGTGGVHVRCVEEVDPRFECLTDQRSAALLIQCPGVGATFRVPEAHAAEHDPGNLQSRAPQTHVFHRSSSLLLAEAQLSSHHRLVDNLSRFRSAISPMDGPRQAWAIS